LAVPYSLSLFTLAHTKSHDSLTVPSCKPSYTPPHMQTLIHTLTHAAPYSLYLHICCEWGVWPLACALQVGCQSAPPVTALTPVVQGGVFSPHYPFVWCAVYIHFAACSLTTNLPPNLSLLVGFLVCQSEQLLVTFSHDKATILLTVPGPVSLDWGLEYGLTDVSF
jgi:hypothetical protein